MAAIERITDLAERIMDLEPRVDGTPLRSLGWVEVAAAMGKLAVEGADLLRCLYLADSVALRRTVRRLEVRLSGGALAPAMCQALAVTTLQAFAAQRPCADCGGHGHIYDAEHEEMDDAGVWVKVPAQLIECATCSGEGVDRIKADAVRELLGVGLEVWQMLLAEPFLELYGELRAWHDQASARLLRQIR